MLHKFDVADATLKTLADLAARIATLLELAHKAANHDLIAVLDELLGAVYALISAREENFKGKAGSSEFAPILTRAKDVAKGEARTDGNWMAGFHFNSAMFRISAVFDRLPKAVACCHVSAASAYQKKTRRSWKKTDAHAIRQQVNDLKHQRSGLYKGRRADLKTAIAAIQELLELAETLA